MFLTIGSLKPDCIGKYLFSTDESESEENDIFSSDLLELLIFLIFVCKKSLRYISVDASPYEILKPYSSLVTFYLNVQYKQKKRLEVIEKWNNFPWK